VTVASGLVENLQMTTVRVNFDYFPDFGDEFLCLEVGEVLTDVLLIEGGWWYGKKAR
jgi:hypothetical protein